MEFFKQGGWVLIAIFALSFFTWFLIIYKWLYLRGETKNGFDWIEPAMTTLYQGSDEKMRDACDATLVWLGESYSQLSKHRIPGKDFLASIEKKY